MSLSLEKNPAYAGVEGPLVFVIMDGVGLYKGEKDGYPGNAFEKAEPTHIHKLLTDEKISTHLKAHGTAVGMPSDDDQGNSEVGHNAIGAGRVFAQGARLVNEAIDSGRIFESDAWKTLIKRACDDGAPVHFIGLLSDGNVHSNIRHLIALIAECDDKGVESVYVHTLLDGRDVPPVSALRYVGELEDYLWSLRVQSIKSGQKRRYFIASGGGRMVTTMDRYEADWRIVERGYNAHVCGEGALFSDATTAIRKLREQEKVDDQYLPPFVIEDPANPGTPVGTIQDGDAVVFFNYRGDRAIEISRAFVEDDFDAFPRKRHPKVFFAGMMEYDGDTHMPPHFLVEPPQIDRTISEYLAAQGIAQFAISETQKYGHMTYFWNGNNSGKFDEKTETWEKIESDTVPFDQKPEMKATEITDAVIAALNEKKYRFIRVNYPNGDMVGHTGSLPAAITAMKALDNAIGRLVEAVDKVGGTLIITADHGNCEQMIAIDKSTGKPALGAGGEWKPLTSHTLNPVPFVIHGPDTDKYALNTEVKDPGLANIAATLLLLLGYRKPDEYCDALITV